MAMGRRTSRPPAFLLPLNHGKTADFTQVNDTDGRLVVGCVVFCVGSKASEQEPSDMSTTSLEREIKLRFSSANEAREALLAAGAMPLYGRRLQEDALLDTE